MPNIQVKLRRGTTAQHAGFTGAEGEVTVDTDKDTVVVHDNATAGGHELRRKDDTIAGSEIDDNAVTSGKISDTDTNFNVTAAGKVGMGAVNTSGAQLEINGDLVVRDTNDNNPVIVLLGTAGAVLQLQDTSTTGSDNGIYNIASNNGAYRVGSISDDGSIAFDLFTLDRKGTGAVARLAFISTEDLIAAQTGFSAEAGMIAYVSDGDSGSSCLAVHDGFSFKRVTLGTTISAT